MPIFSALSLIVVLSSMGLPGLNGFVGEFTILLGSIGSAALSGATAASPETNNAWIYTAFATTGVILAAVYLLKMFQGVFMGPLDNPENKKLRDVNGRELAIFVAFLIFIFWIGIAPAVYFGLMDPAVGSLVDSLNAAATVLR
jgi:NADH-quinone oxidoreductase subunit M